MNYSLINIDIKIRFKGFLECKFIRQVSFIMTKIGGKCQNSNATFLVIFKQCALRDIRLVGKQAKAARLNFCWSQLFF